MTRLLTLCLISFLLVFPLFTNEKKNSNWQQMDYKGHVKNSKYLYFSIKPGSGKAVFTGSIIYHFSKNGALITQEKRNNKEFLIQELKYFNDQFNRVSEKQVFEKNDKIIQSNFKWTDDGALSMMVIDVKQQQYTRTYTVLPDYTLIERFTSKDNNQTGIQIRNIHDASGRVIEKILTLFDDSDQSLIVAIARVTFVYNKDGEMITRREYDSLNNLTMSYYFTYKYDKTGNITEIHESIQRDERHSKRLESIIKIQYVYW